MSDDRSCSDSGKAHSLIADGAYSESQHEAHKHVHAVHDQVRDHRADAVLHSDEPAFEGHQTQCRRRCPYAYEEIAGRQLLHLRSTVDDKESGLDEYPLDGDQGKGACHSDSDRSGEYPRTFLPVPSSERLGRQSAGADAQKAEIPVEQVEEHGTDGDASDHGRRLSVKMAGHGNVHHSYDRDGDVGQNARNGQFKYFLVDCFH